MGIARALPRNEIALMLAPRVHHVGTSRPVHTPNKYPTEKRGIDALTRSPFSAPGRHAHRFPPPWIVEELDACFVGTDSTEVIARTSYDVIA